MANLKDVLVVTSSSVDGLKIRRYLKPVSAHIVAGTNLFSDFLGGLTDVFGGRSHSYQKQLISLYNEAIERIKFAAYEIGANCIIGLNIDMDEISGKGKSMFMLTAVGTAVILEKEVDEKTSLLKSNEKFENVAANRIATLRTKKETVIRAEENRLNLNDETWNFITVNQVDEIFPYLLKKLAETLAYEQTLPGGSNKFYKLLVGFIEGLPEDKRTELLYNSIANEDNEEIVSKLSDIINELNLLDLNKIGDLMQSNDFKIQKRGLRIVTYDKPFYNKQDVKELQSINEYIEKIFVERGTRTTKKQLLSSKEKEVWNCECGKTNNEIGTYCSICYKDIFGFKVNEIKPQKVKSFLKEKIELITEFIE